VGLLLKKVKDKAIPVTGRRGSYIIYTIDSQMAVRIIILLEGLGQVKNAMTSSEIETVTFLVV
jgi:hypothetical protein